ncbi:MAG: CBS domain-containing protein [Sphingobacteriaceae bacterium]
MAIIKDILTKKSSVLHVVNSEATVFDALKIMSEHNIGSIMVLENGKFCGIFSERDYARKVVLAGKASSDTQVKEVMETQVPQLKPTDGIDYCMQLMSVKNIRYLPVFEDQQLMGIISQSDIVKQIIESQISTIEHLRDYIHLK